MVSVLEQLGACHLVVVSIAPLSNPSQSRKVPGQSVPVCPPDEEPLLDEAEPEEEPDDDPPLPLLEPDPEDEPEDEPLDELPEEPPLLDPEVDPEPELPPLLPDPSSPLFSAC